MSPTSKLGRQLTDLRDALAAARELLAGAQALPTAFGNWPVISPEGLIAFKLQGYVNDATRRQDLEDIRALLRANRDSVNIPVVRGYFKLFDRDALLDDLLHLTEQLCPEPPAKPLFGPMQNMRL